MNAKINVLIVGVSFALSISAYATPASTGNFRVSPGTQKTLKLIQKTNVEQLTEPGKEADCNARHGCYVTKAMAQQLFNDYGVDKTNVLDPIVGQPAETPLAGFCASRELPRTYIFKSSRNSTVRMDCDFLGKWSDPIFEAPACDQPVVITADARFPNRTEELCGSQFLVHYAPANSHLNDRPGSDPEVCQLFRDRADLVKDPINPNLLKAHSGVSDGVSNYAGYGDDQNNTKCQGANSFLYRFQSAPIAETHQCTFWVACPCEISFACAPGGH